MRLKHILKSRQKGNLQGKFTANAIERDTLSTHNKLQSEENDDVDLNGYD